MPMRRRRRPDISLVPDDATAESARVHKPRLKKLRFLVLLIPLGLLAAVSTVFGMMMAVSSDLPSLETERQYTGPTPRNSILEDSQGKFIGRLASNQNRIYVKYDKISSYMTAAIIAVEDERFQTNSGVDIRGIARAFFQDVVKQGQRQGGSTITQQFVKNALRAQDKRTVFQKLREAALAYHLTRKWGKKKILQEYLNSIYFGNGAYGIEAAAETYFKKDVNHQGCGKQSRPCAQELGPAESALLAGIVQNPSGYDPVAHPVAARRRRNVVLRKMYEQKYIDASTYRDQLEVPLPAGQDVQPPALDVKVPYFVSWIRQQLVDKYGATKAFEGGLRVRTTIDLDMQTAAENAVRNWLPPGNNGPTAALVAIDNGNGAVRAMVSGTRDFKEAPFNLATQGQRQPGSSFKPFILAEAMKSGYGPGSVWPSRKREFCVVRKKNGKCAEYFVVNNFENTYTGSRTLANALTWSDNSVFATVGIKVGTKKVAKLAERMGIRTPVSHNMAMTLGGLKEGVTPLDMAHAYETFATGGLRVSGSLGARNQGPVGIRYVEDNGKIIRNKPHYSRILSKPLADEAAQVMSTVVSQGTGRRAQVGEFVAGKTGTTENYGDAWFVGFTKRLTVAVWVGYPDSLVPMKTNFEGGPVEGGTFPALIWHDFVASANEILDAYREKAAAANGTEGEQDGEESLPVDDGSIDDTGTTPVPADTGGGDAGDVPTEGGTAQDGDGGATGGGGNDTGAGNAGGGGGGNTPAPDPDPAPATPTPAAPTNQGGGGGETGDGGSGGATPDSGGAAPTGRR